MGDNYLPIYKGMREGIRKHGVDFIMGPRMSPFLQSIECVNERIVVCTLKIGRRKFNVHQVYAPQQGHSQEEMRRFMEGLVVGRQGDDTLVLMGDFPA